MYTKATSNHSDRAETDSLAVLSNVVLQELRVVSKGLDARETIISLESSSTPALTLASQKSLKSVAYLGERVFDRSQQAEARFRFLRRRNEVRDASVS
ncbi:BZ3500_MvSof-1268-A1-R1_Chr10-1g02616 [Microbotryum saponariae]|uniref:BZ3500_MvSof-1268-A1-R1_Chr10-1g02616 protein n=1 Tax=Microbotryum saponariae TaxID=289078 RepID=A0A2X0L479_9BASI|nr:BZ3500_MvSof-1268-A1-R1_Chr10-1g02616 [Microbotryum saponariae]SDA06105.1 BZ3501_MvSof-1269-A2-R1_Chr10-1g02217 [Microbotryum saponariae]